MVQINNGALTFRGYEVIKVRVDKVANENKEAEVGFLFKIAKNCDEKPKKANLYLGVQLNTAGPSGYNIEILLKGNYILEDVSAELAESALIVNASATLFPYVRAVTSVMTSQLECEAVILPTINFHKFFEGVNKEDIFVECDKFEDFE